MYPDGVASGPFEEACRQKHALAFSRLGAGSAGRSFAPHFGILILVLWRRSLGGLAKTKLETWRQGEGKGKGFPFHSFQS